MRRLCSFSPLISFRGLSVVRLVAAVPLRRCWLLVVVVWWWCWREWLDKTPHTHDFRFAERRKMWIGLLVDGARAWVCGGWVGGGAVLRWAARQVDGGGPASLRALVLSHLSLPAFLLAILSTAICASCPAIHTPTLPSSAPPCRGVPSAMVE